MWQGACIVHDEFKAKALRDLKVKFPDAGVLVHPESPADVIELADAVGSTSQLIKASQDMSNQHFIVATDQGIFYKMEQASPNKTFIAAPTGGNGATCRSCANCPWMAMNGLKSIVAALESSVGREIEVDPSVAEKALIPLNRMLDFAAEHKLTVKGNA